MARVARSELVLEVVVAFLTQDLLQAVAALSTPQGVIAFPTDTVYGLGCLPAHVEAISRIYQIKGRDETKPLILMSAFSEALLPFVGEMTDLQRSAFTALMSRHWPGALTLVVPRNPQVVSPHLTRGLETVGLRVPATPALQDLFAMVPGGVLATTSANRSGEGDSVTAGQVLVTVGTQIDALLQEDALVRGAPSTVAAIDLDGTLRVLRQGALVLD